MFAYTRQTNGPDSCASGWECLKDVCVTLIEG